MVMRARRTGLPLRARCFGIGARTGAATPAATPPAALPTTLTVMVVDVQTLSQNSKSAKMVRQQIEAEAQRIHQGI